MFTKISIENYRGIRTGEVDGLGAVNLLVGPNGSGKSTLLEAIFVGAERNSQFWHEDWGRGSGSPLLGARHGGGGFPNQQDVFGKKKGRQIRIEFFTDASEEPRNYTWAYDSNRNGEQLLPVLPPGFQPGETVNQDSPAIKASSEWLSFQKGMKLLDVKLLLSRNCEQLLWKNLLDVRGDRQLYSQINEVYGLNIEGLTYSNDGSLKVLFSDRDYALDVDDLGAGIRIALRLFMTVSLTRDSAVLVEEFDGYQHIETLPKFAKTVLGLAKASNTQLFLATHSLETVRAFVDAAAEIPLGADDLKVFQTRLSADGVFESAALSAEESATLLDGDFDLRRVR